MRNCVILHSVGVGRKIREMSGKASLSLLNMKDSIIEPIT